VDDNGYGLFIAPILGFTIKFTTVGSENTRLGAVYGAQSFGRGPKGCCGSRAGRIAFKYMCSESLGPSLVLQHDDANSLLTSRL
jgi:hypothetical protein